MDKPRGITQEDLENRFTFHPVKDDEQAAKYEQIRDVAGSFSSMIVGLCPPGREVSLAITAIEEAVMWANAAIARHS